MAIEFELANGERIRLERATLLVGKRADGVVVPVLVDTDGSVDTTSGSAPTGAATEAKQDAQITALAKTAPATSAAAVTPSDATVLASRAVWVGGGGDLSVRLSGAPTTTVVFTAVPAGTLLPISVVRVMAATTATNIVVLN